MNAPPGTCTGSANQPGRPELAQSSAMDHRQVWCSTAMSPISPASIRVFRSLMRSRVIAWNGMQLTPARSTASTIRSACMTFIAIGFPRRMCLPACAAATVRSCSSDTGAARCTTSTSSRSSTSPFIPARLSLRAPFRTQGGLQPMFSKCVRALLVAIAALVVALPASAQITTASVTGTVKDPQGGVIPGATVSLISETQGTQMSGVFTNNNGDFTIANVRPDRYTLQITMEGFKTLRRTGIVVGAGERTLLGAMTIEVGGLTDTVQVKAESPIVQAESG